MAERELRWVRCRLVAGHGVASGRAATSPYPAGTIQLQTPFFAARGIDLWPFFAGTLNLEAPRGHWRLSDPDAHFEALEWTDRHPPETFSFWHCRLRVPAELTAAATAGGGAEVSRGDAVRAGAGGAAGAGRGAWSGDAGGLGAGACQGVPGRGTGEGTAPAVVDPAGLAALLYYPHPETKRTHH